MSMPSHSIQFCNQLRRFETMFALTLCRLPYNHAPPLEVLVMKSVVLVTVAFLFASPFVCAKDEVILKANGMYVCAPADSGSGKPLFVADAPTTGSPVVIKLHYFNDPSGIKKDQRNDFAGNFMFEIVHRKPTFSGKVNRFWQANDDVRKNREVRTNDLPGALEGFHIKKVGISSKFKIQSVHWKKYVGVNKHSHLAFVSDKNAAIFELSLSRPKSVLEADEKERQASRKRDVANAVRSSATIAVNRAEGLLSRKFTLFDTHTPALIQLNPYVRSYYVRCDLGNGYKLDYSSEKERNPDTAPEYNSIEEAASSTGNEANQVNDYAKVQHGDYETSVIDGKYVYFSSRRFTDWCCPETFGAYAYSLIASEGETSDEIVAKIREMMLLEYYDIVSWIGGLEDVGKEASKELTTRVLIGILDSLPTPELENMTTAVAFSEIDFSSADPSQSKEITLSIEDLGKLEFRTGHIDYRYEIEPRQANAIMQSFGQLEAQLLGADYTEKSWAKTKTKVNGYLGDRMKFGHRYFSMHLKTDLLPSDADLLRNRVARLNEKLPDRDELEERFSEELARAIKKMSNSNTAHWFELAEGFVKTRNESKNLSVRRITGIEKEIAKEMLGEEIKNAKVENGIIMIPKSSAIRTSLQDFASKNLCIGNEGSAKVEVMEMDVYSGVIRIELSLNHRQSWGTVGELTAAADENLRKQFERANNFLDGETGQLLKSMRDARMRLVNVSEAKLKEISDLRAQQDTASLEVKAAVNKYNRATTSASDARRVASKTQNKLNSQFNDAIEHLGDPWSHGFKPPPGFEPPLGFPRPPTSNTIRAEVPQVPQVPRDLEGPGLPQLR